ncbi:hypothetical protein RYX36_016729 [Vicia faba]
MDEDYLYTCFRNTGKMTSAKVFRNQQSCWDTFSAGERPLRQDEGPDRTICGLTRRSKGYGFVISADEGEQMRAMTEMQSGLK